jgi:predicted nucleic acid-binding protein
MSTPVVLLADANVFLRFLRNDHPEHSPAVRDLMEAAGRGEVILRILEIVVVDTFYTLTAPKMGVSRQIGARNLVSLLQQPGMDTQDKARVFEILSLCDTMNIDYCDAALIVAARLQNLAIVSYDRDFAKASNITAITPLRWREKKPRSKTGAKGHED